MGRKKASSAAAEEVGGDPPVAVTKKNKKKGAAVVDDSEYMVVDQLDDDDSVKSDRPVAVAKKNKKKGGTAVDDREYMVVDQLDDDDASVKSSQERRVSNGKQVLPPDSESDLTASFEEMGLSQKKKPKGKGATISELDPDDDGATPSLDDDGEAAGKKKGKKKGKSKKGGWLQMDEDMEAILAEMEGTRVAGTTTSGDIPDRLEEIEQEDIVTSSGKEKGKENGNVSATITDENNGGYFAPPDVRLDEMDEVIIQFSGKKKGRKGKKSDKPSDDSNDCKLEERSESKAVTAVEKEALVTEQTDKPYSVHIEDDEKLDEVDVETIQFSGKKKGRKGKKSDKPSDDAQSQETYTEQMLQSETLSTIEAEIEGEEPIQFTGKKKGKKGKTADKMAEGADIDAILAELDASKDSREFRAESEDMHESRTDESETVIDTEIERKLNMMEDETIQFAGKKKGKKGKKIEKSSDNADIEAILAELDGPKDPAESRAEQLVQSIIHEGAGSAVDESLATSRKKSKKGKKGGRTAQDEEDLDALLAELDGPKPVKTADVIQSEPLEAVSQQVQMDAVEPVNDPAADDVSESAAAKKKKKKKEKEKEKSKAASSGKQADQVTKEDVIEEKPETLKGKALDKKVPKHIREMQERLAKMKEAEERRKQEEEEKRRKEEEEQRRLEELERQKEEAKKRRKEREKEKLLKKKQEGKLLTGKQKEEARRLAMMREQMLAQKGMTVDSDPISKEEMTTAPKKPKYESKKKRRPHGADVVITEEQIGVDVASMEEHTMEEQEAQGLDVQEDAFMEVEPAPEKEPEVEVYEEEVDVEDEIEEDWDEKSWEEEVALPAVKSAFAEEEEGPTVLKKATKRVVSQPPSDLLPSKIITFQQKPALLVTKQAQPEVQEHGDETESEDESDSDEEDAETRRRREAALKREARKAEALSKRTADDLRSPICCILGHVDTGKTKLLDCIRRTNVQEGEAGGITQQIGATYFPMENIRERTKELKPEANLRVPGLLVIDTPGHESFTNLRARGSGLCDIAILVIDIMHGLEPQTIESLNLLKMRHTPFVVALNKVDRLYNWKPRPNAPIRFSFKQQEKDVLSEFERRLGQITTQLKEQGMNSELYFKNKEIRKYVSIVPTSAISGEGVPDLLMLLVQLTQKLMEEKLMFISEVQCTVLEVKVIEGLGTTIDVILVNGVLHEGDQIVVCGMQGPIVTTIRALLTPHPMKELRVKGSYQHHKELKAAQGIKITAQGLDHAIAGTQLYVVGPEDDLEDLKEEAMQDMKNVMSRVDKSGEGVCVQASTLGSLEALLEFLKSPAVKIPVSGINIGPVHKRDVIRASVMLERKKKEYATILAFDVKVTPEAKELAEELGVKIFMADIIYHLFDQFTAYMNNVKEEKRKEVAEEAVFPCVLKILPAHIYNKKDPIVVGVDVLEGVAKVGTPVCVPSRDFIDIGKIFSIEVNHKVVDTAKKGQSVALKIVGTTPEETQKMLGRHFEPEDELVSHITRRSIDVLKENYRDDLSMDEWRLVLKLKKLFNIP